MSETSEIALEISRKALELGFSACGFASAESLKDLEPAYREWIGSGKAGQMHYLTRNTDVRLNPHKLVEGAKTIISLAANYYFPQPAPRTGNPGISRYARGNDYHQVLKSLGSKLLDWISTEIQPVKGRVFTDSAPILEREWARRAGVGWIGKNGCLIIPKSGSWFFLVEIIIDLEVAFEPEPVTNRCGTCTRCITACPTGALAGDGSMDPRKCISYLTIEHKGEIPDEFLGKLKGWIFGCDICQDVCPWNSKPLSSAISGLSPRESTFALDDGFFGTLTPSSFSLVFDGTPLARAGWSGILRNFEFLKKSDPE